MGHGTYITRPLYVCTDNSENSDSPHLGQEVVHISQPVRTIWSHTVRMLSIGRFTVVDQLRGGLIVGRIHITIPESPGHRQKAATEILEWRMLAPVTPVVVENSEMRMPPGP